MPLCPCLHIPVFNFNMVMMQAAQSYTEMPVFCFTVSIYYHCRQHSQEKISSQKDEFSFCMTTSRYMNLKGLLPCLVL